ncbi:M1 family aminopeptidase [Escherichia coli]
MVIEMNNFYTLTVYEKGAEVIRMIHTLLGEENFQKGMQLYFERHDGSAATCDDFVQAMGGCVECRSLRHFRRWYSQFRHADCDRQRRLQSGNRASTP